MGTLLSPITNLFANHKKKMLLLLVFTLVAALMIFPYDDLSDVVTAQVYARTGNKVYVQFDSLDLNFIPTPGVDLDNVVLEMPGFPTIEVPRLEYGAWIAGAITGKAGGTINAQKLFGGDIEADIKQGEVLKSEQRATTIVSDAKKLNLKQLTDFLRASGRANIPLKGTADFTTDITVDPAMQTPPNGRITADIKALSLPITQLVPAHMSSFLASIPELTFSRATVDASMADGKVAIKSLKLGAATDAISANVSGNLAMIPGPAGMQVSPQNLLVELSIRNDAPSDIVKMAPLIKDFMKVQPQVSPNGQTYRFIANGSTFSPAPAK